MLASALVVFRESVEAALVIGLILGATRGVRGRGACVAAAIAAGATGAAIVALLMGRIAATFAGSGQAVFEAAILLSAVFLIGWHNVWMARHGRDLARRIKGVGGDVGLGIKPRTALFAVAAAAVLREGSEVALFLFGMSASGVDGASLWTGALIGIAGGAILGILLYQGIVRLSPGRLFRATGWLLLLLAAGMASQAASFLNQADLLPAIRESLWDSSALIPGNGLLGTLLKTLVGYTPNPSGLQFVFYAATIIVISTLSRIAQRSARA
jgi:high-affinity iron transporter